MRFQTERIPLQRRVAIEMTEANAKTLLVYLPSSVKEGDAVAAYLAQIIRTAILESGAAQTETAAPAKAAPAKAGRKKRKPMSAEARGKRAAYMRAYWKEYRRKRK